LEQSNIAPKFKNHLSFADDNRSYATNENAIDYNASMIALTAMVVAALE
jgi:endoglucanase